MPSQPLPQTNKQTWLIIFFALVASVGIYGLLGFFILQSPKPHVISPNLATMRPILILLGIAALIASVTWLRFTVDGKIGGEGREVQLSKEEFQTQSIIALALSEACAVFGLLLFFLGAPLEEFAFFAFGTIFVDFAFILPRGLQFWSTQK